MPFSIGQRATKIKQRLLDIRVGSGAIRLPQNVKQINLRFAQKAEQGHLGARKLWREELIRMKYHNPAVPMTIDRTAQNEEPALLSIHFTSSDAPQTSSSDLSSPAAIESTQSSAPPTETASTTRVETIDITNMMNSKILDAIVQATNATRLEETPEDTSLRLDLEAAEAKNSIARELSAEVRRKAKREQELLNRARAGVS